MVVKTVAPAAFEAGELILPKSDVLNPSKLHLLAREGWSIASAYGYKDHTKFLLVKFDTTEKPDPVAVTLGVHQGTSRCPQYCDCFSKNGQKEGYTV